MRPHVPRSSNMPQIKPKGEAGITPKPIPMAHFDAAN